MAASERTTGESSSQPAINSSQSESSGESSPPCPDCDALPDTVAPGEFGESSPPGSSPETYYTPTICVHCGLGGGAHRRQDRWRCPPRLRTDVRLPQLTEDSDPDPARRVLAPLPNDEESSPEKPLLGTTHDPGRADGIVASHPLGGVEQVHASDGRPGLVGDGLPVVAEGAADEPAQHLDLGHGGKDNTSSPLPNDEEVEKLTTTLRELVDLYEAKAAHNEALVWGPDTVPLSKRQRHVADVLRKTITALSETRRSLDQHRLDLVREATERDKWEAVCESLHQQLEEARNQRASAVSNAAVWHTRAEAHRQAVEYAEKRIRELESLLAETQEDSKRCREARARIAELGVHPAPIRDDPIRDDRLTLALTLDVLTSEVRSALHEDAFARVYDIVYRALREDDAARSSPERPNT